MACSIVFSPVKESAPIAHVSSHTKDYAGVQSSVRETRIDDVKERQMGEQGSKSSTMLEVKYAL